MAERPLRPATSYNIPEDERIKNVVDGLPAPLQGALRRIAEGLPGARHFVLGDPHKAIGEVVGRIRDAIRPPQS